MQMRTQHHPSKRKRGSMEEEDRLSSLPEDLLHSILRKLPLKHAVRTSALSRWWAPQWLRALASSRVLDFTDRDLARGQPPTLAVAAIVRRCLELHAEHGTPLDVFRVALVSPPPPPWSSDVDGAFGRDVVGWIASTVARGAREVEVNLTHARRKWHQAQDAVELPGDLFVARNSLSRLALGGFCLAAVPAAPTGLAGLRSLSLTDLTAEAVIWDVVSSCRALEHLRLSSSWSWISHSPSIRIASETLRVLELVECPFVKEVRVTAPALESLAFHGVGFPGVQFNDVPFSPVELGGSMRALRDVYLSGIGCNMFSLAPELVAHLLDRGAHATVWTLSSESWLEEYASAMKHSGCDRTNIHELQLRVNDFERSGYFRYADGFTRFLEYNRLPLLDRLFVRFPRHVIDASRVDANAAEALAGKVVDGSRFITRQDFVLDSLSFIKLMNFRGTRLELELLAFVLERAPALEHLVLVTVGEEGGSPGPGDERLDVIQRHVSAMRKASPHARLTVCRPSQDRSRNPVHTRPYPEGVADDLVDDTEEIDGASDRGEPPSPPRPSRVRRPNPKYVGPSWTI